MTNKIILQENPFKERLNKNRDVIINHIRKVHPNSNIKVMTNKSDILNRAKHFGAHICVDSSHYYYITFSRKDEFCERYFSINANLLELLKHCNEDWHLLLISCGKVHTFDAKAIVENAELFNETTHKVPLSVETSNVDADFRYAYKASECIIDFTYLGNVRYSKKFDMHKKRITICTNYVGCRRMIFDSIVKAYAALTGAKVENGKVTGKPAANATYKKSYKSFLREVNAGSILLTDESGKEFKASVIFNVVPTVVTEAPAEVSTSLLVVDKNTTNSDVDIASDVTENCNNGKVADKQPEISKTTKKEKLAKVDKLYNAMAQKLADKEEHISEQKIKKAVLNIGSNRNMLEAYIDGLKEKHLDKEAVYAATLFDVLNTVKL